LTSDFRPPPPTSDFRPLNLSASGVLFILRRMKITTVVGKTLFFTSLLACGLGRQAMAGEPTALELIKEANHYVGDEVKDKVVQIRSEKSVGTLTPNIWYVVFYDADARMKATEVKFGAGRKLDVQRPFRLLERMKPE